MNAMRCGGCYASVLILALALPVSAQTATVVVDGRPVALDTPPVMQQGRVLVPLRGVFEELGAKVDWHADRRLVVVRAPDLEITLPIGRDQATVNRERMALDVPAQIRQGRTYVPLRFVAEALGADVQWDAARREVAIATPTRIADLTLNRIIHAGDRYQGREVRLTGTYQGRQPVLGAATAQGPPLTRDDWAFDDGTGVIYVAGAAPKLRADQDVGQQVRIEGHVRMSPRGIPYIEATRVEVVAD